MISDRKQGGYLIRGVTNCNPLKMLLQELIAVGLMDISILSELQTDCKPNANRRALYGSHLSNHLMFLTTEQDFQC
jgi:hypothetical protein